MKLLFILFLGCSFFAQAHEDKYVFIQEKNLFIEYRTGWNELEINSQFKIFTHLAKEYLKNNNLNNEVVYLKFMHDHFLYDSNYCAVSYGNFTFDNFQKNVKTKSRGIKIILSARYLNIQETLSLISSSLKNVSYISKNQKRYIRDEHLTINGVDQYDTLESISPQIIKKYKVLRDNSLMKLINKKTYSKLIGREYYWGIEYYYQKNKYHIYNTSYPETRYNPKTGYDDTIKTFGEDILVVSQVKEILGDRFGAFIFTSDSTFYFIPETTDRFSGPFKLDSIVTGRPPIRKFSYEYFDSCTRIFLYFDNFMTYTKAVFIPEKELLINNYHLHENKLVKDLIKHKNDELLKERKYPFIIILSILLLLSLMINYWLFIKSKK